MMGNLVKKRYKIAEGRPSLGTLSGLLVLVDARPGCRLGGSLLDDHVLGGDVLGGQVLDGDMLHRNMLGGDVPDRDVSDGDMPDRNHDVSDVDHVDLGVLGDMGVSHRHHVRRHLEGAVVMMMVVMVMVMVMMVLVDGIDRNHARRQRSGRGGWGRRLGRILRHHRSGEDARGEQRDSDGAEHDNFLSGNSRARCGPDDRFTWSVLLDRFTTDLRDNAPGGLNSM